MAIIDKNSSRFSAGSFDSPYKIRDINPLQSGLDDTSRIGKFLITPAGLSFSAKQIGLQRGNPLIPTESGFNIPGKVGQFLNKHIKESPTRIYNPLNILVQTAANGVGQHVNRHGLNPLDDRGYVSYMKDAIRKNDEGADRLLDLNKRVIQDKNQTVLYSYSGGPKSFYGIGETTVRRYEFTPDFSKTSLFNDYVAQKSVEKNFDWRKKNPLINRKSGSLADNSKYIDEVTTSDINNWKGNPLIFKGVASHSVDVKSDETKPTTNYLGSIQPKPILSVPENINGLGVDSLLPFYTDNPDKPSKASKILDSNGNKVSDMESYLKAKTQDYGKFRIELIDNNNPNYSHVLTFPINIQNFTDSTTSNWKEIKYVGRADSQYVYEGSNTVISFTFKVIAENSIDLKVQHQKLNALKAGMWPDYQNLKMRGSLVKLTVGDRLVRQPGFFTSLTYTIPDDSTWQINTGYAGASSTRKGKAKTPEYIDQQDKSFTTSEMNGVSSINQYTLPLITDVSITFTPIYTFLPQKSLSRTAFVLPPGSDWLQELSNLETVPDKGSSNNDNTPDVNKKPVKNTAQKANQYKQKDNIAKKPVKK